MLQGAAPSALLCWLDRVYLAASVSNASYNTQTDLYLSKEYGDYMPRTSHMAFFSSDYTVQPIPGQLQPVFASLQIYSHLQLPPRGGGYEIDMY